MSGLTNYQVSKMSKVRNKIDVDHALCVLTDAGYEPEEFNFYQLRIISKKTRTMYDWYWTTGSLVKTRNNQASRIGAVFEVEKLVEIIKYYDNPLR